MAPTTTIPLTFAQIIFLSNGKIIESPTTWPRHIL
jgi:hypothetical protein